MLQNLINMQNIGFKFLLYILNCNQFKAIFIAIFIRTVRLIYKIIFQQRSIRKHPFVNIVKTLKKIFDKRIKINNDIRQ